MTSNQSIAVEQWDGDQDAIILKPEARKRHGAYRWSLSFVVGSVVLFPLFFGGKDEIAINVMKLLIFGFALTVSAVFLVKESPSGLPVSFGPIGKHFAICFFLFLGLVVVQLTPISPFLLHLLSRVSFQLYEFSGLRGGRLSLEAASTLSALTWVSALAIMGLWLSALPRESIYATVTSLASSKGRRRLKQHPTLLASRERDYVADILQKAILFSGILCTLVAISHWSFAAEALFGFFTGNRPDLDSTRAHWPFANPDHLAVLLEMAIIVCFTRLLQANQLNELRKNDRAGGDNFSLKLLKSPEKFGKQAVEAMAFFVMVLACILALSRAGNILVFFGCSILWMAYGRYPVKPRLKPVVERARKGEFGFLWNFTKLRRPLVVIGFVFFVLLFLGQTGRELARNRIEYGLLAGYDEMRRSLAQASLKMIFDYPLFGVGLGCWALAAPKYISHGLAGWELSYAHNDFLQLFAEVGVFGILIVVGGLWILCRMSWRVWNLNILPTQRIELLGGFLTIALPLLHCLVDFPFHIPSLAFIFVVALASYVRLVERYLLEGKSVVTR